MEQNRIKELSEMQLADDYVISLYLKLDAAARENFKYRITLKNLVNKTRESLESENFTKDQLRKIEKDLQTIEDLLNDKEQTESCNGIAFFLSSSSGIWEFFRLPFVYRNRLIVGRHPLVGELMKINEESEPVPFIVIDRVKARLFNVTFDDAKEVEGYIYPSASRTQKFRSDEGSFRQKVAGGSGAISAGFGEHKFNRTIENDYHQHLKFVSDRLFEYYKSQKFSNFIIGGSEQTVKDFIPHLHSYLKDKVLGTAVVDAGEVKSDRLINITLNLLEEKKVENQKRVISEFSENSSDGLSVSGIEPVLNALMNGQIKTLLIEEGFSRDGYMCPDTGLITLKKDSNMCPEGKNPVYISDILDLVTEETLKQNSEVVVVEKDLAQDTFTGAGAILRFKL